MKHSMSIDRNPENNPPLLEKPVITEQNTKITGSDQ